MHTLTQVYVANTIGAFAISKDLTSCFQQCFHPTTRFNRNIHSDLLPCPLSLTHNLVLSATLLFSTHLSLFSISMWVRLSNTNDDCDTTKKKIKWKMCWYEKRTLSVLPACRIHQIFPQSQVKYSSNVYCMLWLCAFIEQTEMPSCYLQFGSIHSCFFFRWVFKRLDSYV